MQLRRHRIGETYLESEIRYAEGIVCERDTEREKQKSNFFRGVWPDKILSFLSLLPRTDYDLPGAICPIQILDPMQMLDPIQMLEAHQYGVYRIALESLHQFVRLMALYPADLGWLIALQVKP